MNIKPLKVIKEHHHPHHAYYITYPKFVLTVTFEPRRFAWGIQKSKHYLGIDFYPLSFAFDWEKWDEIFAKQEAAYELIANAHQLENTEEVLYYTHPASMCKGEACTIHNMSDHHMRSWPQHWRGDYGFIERICPHGVGHPDPDEPADVSRMHGCDGCCRV